MNSKFFGGILGVTTKKLCPSCSWFPFFV